MLQLSERTNHFLNQYETIFAQGSDCVVNNIVCFMEDIAQNAELFGFVTKSSNSVFHTGREVEAVLSSYGSRRFNFGNSASEVVFHTYQLLNYIIEHEIPIDYLGASYTKSGDTEERTEAFVKQVVYPFIESIKNHIGEQELRNMNQKIKVFLVHGHDDSAKLEMARVLEKAGFEVIILHEQASAGKTIIEKIEAYTEVAFAVVLYTPCDMGRAKEAAKTDEKSRARQNVVFEHGYLIGKLGRERVCALVKGDIETPGDISGVVYIAMDDAGAWKMTLAKEMKATGIQVDMNRFCL